MGRRRAVRRRILAYVSRQRVAVFLFAVAVITGLVTYRIYPRTPAVTVQGGIQRISVVGPLEPAGVDIKEQPDGHGGVYVGVALRAAQPLADPFPDERLVVAVTSPGQGRCPEPAIACDSSGGARTLYYQFPAQRWVDAGSSSIEQYKYSVVEDLEIPDVEANLAQDRLDVAVTIPQVSVLHYQYVTGQPVPAPAYLSDPSVVDFGALVRDGPSYTWQGSVPVYTRGFDYWIYNSASSAAAALDPVQDGGTDQAVENRNTTLVFLAGILLGIAGGALVGAAQSAISTPSSAP